MSSISIRGNTFNLLPEKAIFWEDRKALVLSDVHLGKSAHFRKHGIAIPNQVNQENLWVWSDLLQKLNPEECIIIGDLFHSVINHEWDQFVDFLGNFTQIRFILVEGNHDLLPEVVLKEAGLEVHERITLNGISFVHEPEHRLASEFTFCGHIHPAIRLVGKA
ncbi:MAG: ligase-associated DNA damage response endonuclease PdeM [Flavobacteriales bacterium]|nr:ligase-associated DNA damage response endonuclease PdeM [Flavobacteriales bacterium]